LYVRAGRLGIYSNNSQSKNPNCLNVTFTMSHSAARLSFRNRIL